MGRYSFEHRSEDGPVVEIAVMGSDSGHFVCFDVAFLG